MEETASPVKEWAEGLSVSSVDSMSMTNLEHFDPEVQPYWRTVFHACLRLQEEGVYRDETGSGDDALCFLFRGGEESGHRALAEAFGVSMKESRGYELFLLTGQDFEDCSPKELRERVEYLFRNHTKLFLSLSFIESCQHARRLMGLIAGELRLRRRKQQDKLVFFLVAGPSDRVLPELRAQLQVCRAVEPVEEERRDFFQEKLLPYVEVDENETTPEQFLDELVASTEGFQFCQLERLLYYVRLLRTETQERTVPDYWIETAIDGMAAAAVDSEPWQEPAAPVSLALPAAAPPEQKTGQPNETPDLLAQRLGLTGGVSGKTVKEYVGLVRKQLHSEL